MPTAKAPTITVPEWLSELRRLDRQAGQRAADGITTRDIVARLGVSQYTARNMIRRAVAAGILRHVGWIRCASACGIDNVRRPVYQEVRPAAQRSESASRRSSCATIVPKKRVSH